MVRRSILFFVFILFASLSYSQIYDPVTWEFGYEKKGGNQYELVFRANIEEGSHIYAMDIPEGGPIPTLFSVDSASVYSVIGKTYQVTKPEELYDEAFEMNIRTFSNTAEFRQKITGSQPQFTVTGTVNYMACNNKTCSPPKDVEFSIDIKGENKSQDASLISGDEEGTLSSKGLLSFFFWSFILGLVGVLTPCVYPMIPMTVAFFTRGSENRSKAILNALIFGLSIVLIYTSPGIIISLTGAGAGFANALSTHWIPNIIFFLLFVIFSVSFLGAFELVLPSKWANSADAKVDRGGMLASFFMALTTVIVSFSCTGPIVGGLLVEAARGDVLRPTVGMFAFGLAFAMPFTIFALFPAVLNKLPKSGGWLNSIKVVLAFLMLAFSLKFLVTVDSVYNLNFISRDVFLAIWIVLFSLLGLYLMGKIKFSHDSDLPHIGTFRLFLVIAVFSFVVYMIPGLFGSPLTALSSFMPSGNSELDLSKPVSVNVQTSAGQPGPVATSEQCQAPKYGDFLHMPLGLTGFFDYKQGLACAKEKGKPVFLDFKGHACANCKLMEAKVWSDPEVLRMLKEEFVIIALYMDDRTQLPESEWVTSSVDGKVKKTIGKVNEDLEISKFKTNSMPLYVITDYEGNPLNKPMPTNLNVEEYKAWLDEGIAAFNAKAH
ncbi:MAG TPA: cytochrome c biogenesis protein CcdA [Bacteroidales bacterium]|nr:cytochrome c biogenesis protein CcdA [Bacteroidales bacterium]